MKQRTSSLSKSPRRIKLRAVGSPGLSVVLPSGKRLRFDAAKTLNRLEAASAEPSSSVLDVLDSIRRAFDFPTAAEAKRTGQFTLTPQMCLALRTALVRTADEVFTAKKRMKSNAELMRFFHQPASEIARLSKADKLALMHWRGVLEAREQWNLFHLMSAVRAKDATQYLMRLAEQAFGDDEQALGWALHSISTRGG